jgi:hypothetical protein
VISFEWNGQRRRIQISKSDVVGGESTEV